MLKTVNFLGVKVGAFTIDEIVERIVGYALEGKRKFITYLNAHCANIACVDQEYRLILNKADFVYAEGQGVVWASRFLGTPLPQRVNILDFFDKLSQELSIRKITIFLLGGKRGVAKKVEEVLKKKGLIIVGSREGFFTKDDEEGIVREINALCPDILIVGMGSPKQEKWIYSYLNELDVHLCWAVGAAFDWLSGHRKRAPKWMIRCGLEWLHRLCQEPKRLYKRYLFGNFLFIYHFLRFKFKKKI